MSLINEVIEEINEENHKDVKEEEPTPTPKPKPKPKPNDLVFCPDCSRQMTYKIYDTVINAILNLHR